MFKIPPCFWLVSSFLSRFCSIWDYELCVILKAGTYKLVTTFRPKTISPKSFLYTDVSTFSNMDKIRNETFPHFQKLTKIRVSIIVSIPHSPTVWNTNDDKIVETRQNQEMFQHFKKNRQNQEMWIRFLYRDVSTFSKMGKIKKCRDVSTFSKNGQNQEMWNTNTEKILETGQNQEMFPHFQKIDKIKKCEYVST